MFGKYTNYILLHLIVLIFGLTGPIGKAITVSEDVIVFYRLLFAVLGIGAFMWFKRKPFNLSKKALAQTSYIGVIVGLHWLTFFASIKAANVSIALICFSSGTFFTSLIEPIYLKRKINWIEVGSGIAIMLALYILLGSEATDLFNSKYGTGIMLSFLSAFLASWFTVLNARLLKKERKATEASFQTLFFAFLTLCIYIILTQSQNPVHYLTIGFKDLLLCFVLGIVCTSFAYIVSIEIMKEVSPFTVNLSINLEPVYAMALAAFLWPDTEQMRPSFYLGAALILSIIILNAFLKRRQRLRTISQ